MTYVTGGGLTFNRWGNITARHNSFDRLNLFLLKRYELIFSLQSRCSEYISLYEVARQSPHLQAKSSAALLHMDIDNFGYWTTMFDVSLRGDGL